MFKELNPLLHSELRLAVVSILIGVESADFVFIRQQTGATAGNLSVQLDKLAKAGYIEVEKTFRGKIPCTVCRITDAGRDAFAELAMELLAADGVELTHLARVAAPTGAAFIAVDAQGQNQIVGMIMSALQLVSGEQPVKRTEDI